ncbi:alpha/beta hydrolase family protein [Corynebacterium glucuronolyticum]|uniref:Prolyl oligopeptidase family protein n=1 Tax=Corynebacterium glucuronolyticum TaxID=39791 RepID=A0AAX1L7L7_9CORY|nr:hypothetical protein [Corynebacterium glucuronolyticum]QQU88711.1 hypothetical protein I6I68_01575 [Corynebacterium glucuronolyticum]QRP70410.1 hypothetical protein I6J21_11760 [Corynebacterium glucuronolyticum]
MIDLFTISFTGFHSGERPKLQMDRAFENNSAGCILNPCSISLPESSLISFEVAVECANEIIENLLAITEGSERNKLSIVNLLAVSEGCGLIRFLCNTTSKVKLNAVLVSACFDRVRTPFGNSFALELKDSGLCHTPPWFDWRQLSVRAGQRLLICHGTQDLNPSTPFLDAWSFFLRAVSSGKDISLIQVGGAHHGYACLSNPDIRERIINWLYERAEK